ncbi:hypothetical protein F4604DRAFT_1720766 [Suillus subluteus]|nr:hypothetical protein F4604DRAFT_1720766 [Suillus subluteus]
MNDWRQDIQKLMSWLDWSVWIKCRPACGPEVGSKRGLRADWADHYSLAGNVLSLYLARECPMARAFH